MTLGPERDDGSGSSHARKKKNTATTQRTRRGRRVGNLAGYREKAAIVWPPLMKESMAMITTVMAMLLLLLLFRGCRRWAAPAGAAPNGRATPGRWMARTELRRKIDGPASTGGGGAGRSRQSVGRLSSQVSSQVSPSSIARRSDPSPAAPQPVAATLNCRSPTPGEGAGLTMPRALPLKPKPAPNLA